MKNFLHIKEIPLKELTKIISDAKIRKKKRKKFSTLEPDKNAPLKNKLSIQIFEKSSLRTRVSFYIAIKQLGGSAITLRPDELHIKNGGESISDIAKILSMYSDLFIFRTNSDIKIKKFEKFLTIPFINGLSPKSHPAQILSDIFTIEEIKNKSISKLNIAWVGDSNNVLNSLIEASIKFSFRLNIGCPDKFKPKKEVIKWIATHKGKVNIYNNPKNAVKNADVILTDKVISMNDKINKKKKIDAFKKFKIDNKLIKNSKKDCIILHCLPRGNEITNEVFLSKNSKVWQQALNRVHVQKSIILYCLDLLR